MSSSDGPRFSCAACGKRFRWKPEFAGRTAKCACGAKLVVPAESPAEATPPQDNDETKCPSCSEPLVAGAVLCVQCGYNLKTGMKMAAVVIESDEEEESEEDAAKEEERA